MGNNRVKVLGLRVVEIDAENHLVLVKGGVPGSRGGYVYVTPMEKEGQKSSREQDGGGGG
jgi:large subunit ribosomal protein L3